MKSYLHNMPSYEKASIFGTKWINRAWNPSRFEVCRQGESLDTAFCCRLLACSIYSLLNKCEGLMKMGFLFNLFPQKNRNTLNVGLQPS